MCLCMYGVYVYVGVVPTATFQKCPNIQLFQLPDS